MQFGTCNWSKISIVLDTVVAASFYFATEAKNIRENERRIRRDRVRGREYAAVFAEVS